MSAPPISLLLNRLGQHERRARRSLNFTPSENVLSPLARLPLVLDTYPRYFFDDLRIVGDWQFFGGVEAGQIELEVLVPTLRQLTGAEYVDVRPISGLNCMTVAMAALCPAGGTMYSVAGDSGGHLSSIHVAERLGIRTVPLPMPSHQYVDLEALERMLRTDPPALVYLDQATQLFPIDPKPIRALLDLWAPKARLHYDSSHTNGLILGGALPNPLERGAHSFGGSCHKTLPGPHKGFLATNDAETAERIDKIASHFVSHHHLGEVVSLAITLIELQEKNGAGYAQQILDNAKVFASVMAQQGVEVAAPESGYTGCHQVWAAPADGVDANRVARLMAEHGLLVNRFGGLPGIARSAFRLSVAEVTRLGATEQTMERLARVFAESMRGGHITPGLSREIQEIRAQASRPRYCYTSAEAEALGLDPALLPLLREMERAAGS